MTKLRSSIVVLSCMAAACTVQGFAPNPSYSTSTVRSTTKSFHPAVILSSSKDHTATLTTLHEKKKEKSSDSSSMPSNKLLAETIAPFRGLRLFFYAAFASGAFVGGLITASGVAAALSGVREDLDLNAEYLNLAIDFGAVAIFGILAKIDLDKGAELDEKVQDKVQRTKEQKKVKGAMKERETQLKELSVNVRVTEMGEMKEAPIGIMQERAKQHIILVAGPGRAIRDALRGAQLNKVNFAMTNILVVPYQTDIDAADRAAKPDGSGFGDSRPAYETQSYVAEPVGDGWDEFISAEIETAAEQAGDKVREEGVALVIANDGSVLRRGVGKVPWRQMVDELEEAVTGEKKDNAMPSLLGFIEE